MKIRTIILGLSLGLSGLINAGCSTIATVAGDVEEPKYTVVKKADNNIEMREYPAQIVAETIVVGEREKAINDGFKIVADYIFGNNVSQKKVAMTAPVTQVQSKEIEVKTAVLQDTGPDNIWVVQFIMPSEYTMETLPQPQNTSVILREIPPRRLVSIEFSGRSTEDNLMTNQKILFDYIRSNGLQTLSQEQYAFYNPPWTLPMLRRNEISVEVAR